MYADDFVATLRELFEDRLHFAKLIVDLDVETQLDLLRQHDEISRHLLEEIASISVNPKIGAPRPPNAERLAYFSLPKQIRGNLLGDLEEQFADMADTLGERGARLWYWKEVLAAIAILNVIRLSTGFDRVCDSLARLRKSQ